MIFQNFENTTELYLLEFQKFSLLVTCIYQRQRENNLFENILLSSSFELRFLAKCQQINVVNKEQKAENIDIGYKTNFAEQDQPFYLVVNFR